MRKRSANQDTHKTHKVHRTSTRMHKRLEEAPSVPQVPAVCNTGTHTHTPPPRNHLTSRCCAWGPRLAQGQAGALCRGQAKTQAKQPQAARAAGCAHCPWHVPLCPSGHSSANAQLQQAPLMRAGHAVQVIGCGGPDRHAEPPGAPAGTPHLAAVHCRVLAHPRTHHTQACPPCAEPRARLLACSARVRVSPPCRANGAPAGTLSAGARTPHEQSQGCTCCFRSHV